MSQQKLDENISRWCCWSLINFFHCYISCIRECSRGLWKWIRPAAKSQPVQYTQPRPQQQRKQEQYFPARNHRDYAEHPGYNNTNTGVQFFDLVSVCYCRFTQLYIQQWTIADTNRKYSEVQQLCCTLINQLICRKCISKNVDNWLIVYIV